jgi:hypothetical protein
MPDPLSSSLWVEVAQQGALDVAGIGRGREVAADDGRVFTGFRLAGDARLDHGPQFLNRVEVSGEQDAP